MLDTQYIILTVQKGLSVAAGIKEAFFIRALLFVNDQPHIKPLTRILWYLVLQKI